MSPGEFGVQWAMARQASAQRLQASSQRLQWSMLCLPHSIAQLRHACAHSAQMACMCSPPLAIDAAVAGDSARKEVPHMSSEVTDSMPLIGSVRHELDQHVMPPAIVWSLERDFSISSLA